MELYKCDKNIKLNIDWLNKWINDYRINKYRVNKVWEKED